MHALLRRCRAQPGRAQAQRPLRRRGPHLARVARIICGRSSLRGGVKSVRRLSQQPLQCRKAVRRVPAAASPLWPAASAQRPSATARAPPEPVHRVCPYPATRRALPRRVRKSRAEPQAHPDARRTFEEPRGSPETDEERARDVLHMFLCHVTAGTRHPQ